MPTLLQRQGAQAELTEIWRDVAESGEQHIIRVQYVDFRHDHEPIENGVARFTTRNQSPSATGDILLRVPKYYRKLEDGDPLDGATKADVAPLVARHLTSTGVPVSASQFRAHGTLASPDEPWIFCTSIRPCHPEGANALERRFSDKGADAAVTTIADPGAFARQLGIDVARSRQRWLPRRTMYMPSYLATDCRLPSAGQLTPVWTCFTDPYTMKTVP